MFERLANHILNKATAPSIEPHVREVELCRESVSELNGVMRDDGVARLPEGWNVYEVEVVTPNSWRAAPSIGAGFPIVGAAGGPSTGAVHLGCYALQSGPDGALADSSVSDSFKSALEASGALAVSMYWRGTVKADFERVA